jgi:uroporphyrin-III C-methyltransferase
MTVLETTLGQAPQDVLDHNITPPAIIAVGEVVRMRQCLDWISQMKGIPPRHTDPLGTRQREDSA